MAKTVRAFSAVYSPSHDEDYEHSVLPIKVDDRDVDLHERSCPDVNLTCERP
jgi:hypothetical protein